MKNLLDTSKCEHFQPSFDTESECDYYQIAENDSMEPSIGECGYCKRPQSYRCVADIARLIPLSHSSVDTFLICHYLYYLKKILGIEMRPQFFGSALKAGQLWDTVKQKHLGEDVSIKGIIQKYQIDEFTVNKVKAIYKAYKELGIQVEGGHSLQAKVGISIDIEVPAISFLPKIDYNTDYNYWSMREDLEGDGRDWQFPLLVAGFYDRKYPTYFCEDKLSSRPEFYLDPFYLQSQNSTYFLADPKLEYCIQEVVLMPQQKVKKKSTESAEQLGKRIYDDILSRPSKYFLGYNRKSRMYGKKFFRGEFDLQATEDRYKQVVLEILSCRWTGNFYRNFKACNNILPGIVCDMQQICRNGNMSENMFKIREKK